MKRGVRVCVALAIVSVVGGVSAGGTLEPKSRITEFSAGITAFRLSHAHLMGAL